MKQEYLERLKSEFERVKNKQALQRQEQKRLQELEKIPEVQEYIRLKESVKQHTREKTPEEIINDICLKIHIKDHKDTNGIYYCLGTFKRVNYEEVKVPYDDPTAEYRVYVNIETWSDVVKRDIKNCSEFETTHPVIISNPQNEGETEYSTIQKEFFLTSIKETQEVALKRLLARTKKMPK